jgi:thymidylate kinase
MTKSSLFICFTGIDGSGKSSQAQLLQKHLNSSGITAVYTWSRWEPYLLKPFIKRFKKVHTRSTIVSSDIPDIQKKKQKLLHNPIILWLWLNLALFDYYLQVKRRVLSYMNKNSIIICDRYVFDFIVDQAVNIGKKSEGLESISRTALLRLFPLPDLLFILDVSPETGHKRKNDGTSIEYLMKRQELYSYYKNLPNAILVDANNPFEIVAYQITEHTNSFLKEHGIFNG